MKTTKKPNPPEPPPAPVNTCNFKSPVLNLPPDNAAVILTKEIQDNNHTIDDARSEIWHLEQCLAQQKARLSDALINHSHTSRRLDDMLRVSQPITA